MKYTYNAGKCQCKYSYESYCISPEGCIYNDPPEVDAKTKMDIETTKRWGGNVFLGKIAENHIEH